ncbi:MAG: type I-E CRISPR-associated protein Cas5/CasD [Candidatus Methanoperedens sp.]|jgi:CRISPR system Cascade subunit CasD|nr:type I-E CRISPR-associated protein Cas5/CasD [Candidatus Methanoperedens sp.]PKL53545.1 MAG: type I-E CRISPR-associated protein Cas5/CasD [Candidatus Methanoperedenaceae archaeon HGW-Methanoperedenaceae-1]
MTKYLVFRLYGPMASWGDVAVGTYRPTFDHPSKSAVMGLLAAAIGIRRDEDVKLRAIAESYDFAVRVDASGTMLRDYHTSQVPPSGTGRNLKHFATRKDELAVSKSDLKTILSTRDYYCDAVYTVCLWSKTDEVPYSLETLAQKLKEPEFVLYLGRKSCPLAMPVAAKVVSGANIQDVFGAMDPDNLLGNLKKDDSMRLYWEGTQDAGVPAMHTITRRDDPLSRKRWQFADRMEHFAVVQPGGRDD